MSTRSRRALVRTLAALPALSALSAVPALRPGAARAQSAPWPQRPIRLIVPYAPGGGSDIVGRRIAAELAGAIGHPVVVENIAGAGSVRGASVAASAPADGHDLLLVDTTHTIVPFVQRLAGQTLPFDPIRDFTALGQVAASPMVLVTRPGFAPGGFADLRKRAASTGTPVKFANGGSGTATHLTAVLLEQALGAGFTHVPYRGTGALLPDLAGGHVDTAFLPISNAAGPVRGGQLQLLVAGSAQRIATFGDVPTLRESGVDLVSEHWFGLLAPARLPVAIRDRLGSELARAVGGPAIGEGFAQLGILPRASSPEVFHRFLNDELARWERVVAAADIKPV